MISTQRYVVVSIAAALVTFGAFLSVSMVVNGGRFEYALDDVYIHLAMAEQLFAGGYGVNASEFSSASSSPLYPLLLPTWFGLSAQFWLPFLWNVVFIAAAAGLLGWAIAQANLSKGGVWIAALAPFALAMHFVAFSGMENMGHGAASLAIVVGLVRFIETSRVGALLILGVFLAPALRLEGVAMALAAAGVVFVMGKPLAGVLLAGLAALPVVVFVGALTTLGLDPLPNSVNAKLPGQAAEHAEGFAGLLETFGDNIGKHGGMYVLALVVVVWMSSMLAFQRGMRGQGLIGLAVVISALAHLSVASTGWMDRYENYLVLSLFAILAVLCSASQPLIKTTVLSIALVGGVLTYAPNLLNFAQNPRAITLQHGQMARFAKDHVQGPVAVNDLGYVAWNNPDYVLDLWGLASAEALETRQSSPPDGWADELADRYGVRVAMVYDRWVMNALGPDWVPLGKLALLGANDPVIGGFVVSFYARNQAEADGLQADIRDWSAGLPDGAQFVLPGEDLRP